MRGEEGREEELQREGRRKGRERGEEDINSRYSIWYLNSLNYWFIVVILP